MDLGDITQLTLVATFTLVVGRIGWSLARLIDRRAYRQPALTDDAAERIRTLEDEQMAVRQELVELRNGRTSPSACCCGRSAHVSIFPRRSGS